MSRKARPKLTLTCTCGNECEVKIKATESRSIFNHTEKYYISNLETFAITVIDPMGHSVEIACKECGAIWRINREEM